MAELSWRDTAVMSKGVQMRRFLFIWLLLVPSVSLALPTVDYSGQLLKDGQPYDGEINIVISLYDAMDSEEALWTETHETVTAVAHAC